jgi:hypothetical protein
LKLHPQAQYQALQAARAWYASGEGKQRYQHRAGVECTLSQGVRAFGLRRTRYRGLAKTHLQHVATAAAINMDRLVAWLDEYPRRAVVVTPWTCHTPYHIATSDMTHLLRPTPCADVLIDVQG